MDALLLPILLILLGLLLGVILKMVSAKIRIPYTVLLFMAGCGLGILYNNGFYEGRVFMETGLDMVSNMNPDFVLYVFLPILIFDAAYEMNLHVFKKTLFNASLLAGPGLVICMLLTAAFIMLGVAIFPEGAGNWGWTYALMFGGLISATDPVAVVALLQELKTSRRFSTLVDGESLLNDGTGIVCFMLFYSTFIGKTITMGPVLFFCWVCVASAAIGYFIAKITLAFIIRVCKDETLQNCIMIIAAYITFILAQKAFDVSGVIALVVFGHIFSQSGRPLLKPKVNEFMGKFWGFLAHIANTLIFLIVGIIIATKVNVTWKNILVVFLLYIALNVIRYIMIAVLSPIIRKSGYGLSFKESIILGWGGLRGALGMSMALMVCYTPSIPEDVRNDILLYTAGVVTLTLCINATTSKWLLGKLGLIKRESQARMKMEQRVNEKIRQSNIEKLEMLRKEPALAGTDWVKVASCIPQEQPVSEHISSDIDLEQELRMLVLENEHNVTNAIFQQGIISKKSYLRLTDSIDDLCDYEGERKLSLRSNVLSLKSVTIKYHISQIALTIFSKLHLTPISFTIFESQYDLMRGFIISQEAGLKLLDNINESKIVEHNFEVEVVNKLKEEISSNISEANSTLDMLRSHYPEMYDKAVTNKAIRMLLADERITVENMQNEGLISEDEASRLIEGIDKKQNLGIIE